MAHIIDDSIFEEGSTYHTQQLKAEVFKQQIRLDAKKIIGERERDIVNATFEGKPCMIYDPLPTETPDLMPGLVPESGTTAIVGETNTGKSLIALEICSSLLTGEPLWGAIRPNRTIEKVVYVLGEHTCATIQGLYHRTQLPHSGNFQLIGPEHLHPYKAVVIGGIAQQAAIDRLCKWTEGANLIVFDPLSGFIQGLQGEQDNISMRTLIDSLSLVATKNNAACLILSHMGKPKIDEQGAEQRRTSYAMRGASSQEDALTHVFYLRKGITTKQMGSQELYDLSVRKFKGNPSNDTFKLQRDPDTKRNTLLNAVKSKTGGVSVEDKLALMAKIGRIREANPKMDTSTVISLVAAAEGMQPATLERWLEGMN